MRFTGRVFRSGKYWAAEVPILGVVTQGRTKKNALEMTSDAIESLMNKKGFRIDIFPGQNSYFEVGSPDTAALVAFLLRRQRIKHGLSLLDVTKRMGAKSHNSYARYEQGKSVPTIEKFNQLLSAISPDRDYVLAESPID
jgi:predicted RNase H-like HicB family nuclease